MNRLGRLGAGFIGTVGLIGLLLQTSAGQTLLEENPPCCWDMWDPGWTQRYLWGPGHMGPRQRQMMLRHWTFMHEGVPTAYRGQSSIIEVTDDAIQAGAALYEANCASCHGPSGQGGGSTR